MLFRFRHAYAIRTVLFMSEVSGIQPRSSGGLLYIQSSGTVVHGVYRQAEFLKYCEMQIREWCASLL